jgi:hypothetical protein
MKQATTTPSRKRFLFLGAAILSSLAFFKIMPRTKKGKKETVKMLSQDGRLVEIDKSLLATSGKKINNKDLREWIKNK